MRILLSVLWPIAFAVVQSPSHVQLFVTPWTAARQASLSLIISWSLPKFMFIASVMLSSHLILWRCLLLLPSILPSIRDFSNESFVLIRWSASVSVLPVNTQDGSPLTLTGLIFMVSKGLSGVFSSNTVPRQSILWYNSHSHTWPLGRPFSSVQFSLSVRSDSLWPYGLQHTRLPYPSLALGACTNSCLLSW